MLQISLYLWLLQDDNQSSHIIDDTILIHPIETNKFRLAKNILCSRIVPFTHKFYLLRALFEQHIITMKDTEKVWAFTDTYKLKIERNIRTRDVYKISEEQIVSAVEHIGNLINFSLANKAKNKTEISNHIKHGDHLFASMLADARFRTKRALIEAEQNETI